MLSNEGWGEFLQRFANLWNYGGADEVFDGLFGRGRTVDFYLELGVEASVSGSGTVDERNQGNIRRTHLPLYRVPPLVL